MSTKEYFAQISEDREQHEVFTKFFQNLSRFDGKKVTQKIVTFLRETFPDYTFYGNWAGSKNFQEYSVECHYGVSKHFTFRLVGFGSSDILDLQNNWKSDSNCFGNAAKIRLEKFDATSEEQREIFRNRAETLEKNLRELQKEIEEVKESSLHTFGYGYHTELRIGRN